MSNGPPQSSSYIFNLVQNLLAQISAVLWNNTKGLVTGPIMQSLLTAIESILSVVSVSYWNQVDTPFATSTQAQAGTATNLLMSPATSSFAALINTQIVTPQFYGAKADLVKTTATITASNGQPNVSFSVSIFAPSDVGKYLTLAAAGFAAWSGIILSQSGNGVVLSTNAPWDATTQSMRLVYAHDDASFIQQALSSSQMVILRGNFGIASTVTLSDGGFKIVGVSPNQFRAQIVALAPMSVMLSQDSGFTNGGVMEDVLWDGNKLADTTCAIGGAYEYNLRGCHFYNAKTNANLKVGNGTGTGNQNHFWSIECHNEGVYQFAELPANCFDVEETDSTFHDAIGVNARVCHFNVGSGAFNTTLIAPHMWSSPGLAAPLQYSINASTRMFGPTCDTFGAVGIAIKAANTQIIGGLAEIPFDSSSIGITIDASIPNVLVLGFDASVIASTSLRVQQATPVGVNNVVQLSDGNGSLRRTDLGSGNSVSGVGTDHYFIGSFNTHSGQINVSIGNNHIRSGTSTIGLGQRTNDWGAQGTIAENSGGAFSNVVGSSQIRKQVLFGTTPDATPIFLTANGASTLANFNSLNLPFDSGSGLYGRWSGFATVECSDAAGDLAYWVYVVSFARKAAGVRLVKATLIDSTIDASLAGVTISFGADVTNLCGYVQATGLVGTTLHWNAAFFGLDNMA